MWRRRGGSRNTEVVAYLKMQSSTHFTGSGHYTHYIHLQCATFEAAMTTVNITVQSGKNQPDATFQDVLNSSQYIFENK